MTSYGAFVPLPCIRLPAKRLLPGSPGAIVPSAQYWHHAQTLWEPWPPSSLRLGRC